MTHILALIGLIVLLDKIIPNTNTYDLKNWTYFTVKIVAVIIYYRYYV